MSRLVRMLKVGSSAQVTKLSDDASPRMAGSQPDQTSHAPLGVLWQPTQAVGL